MTHTIESLMNLPVGTIFNVDHKEQTLKFANQNYHGRIIWNAMQCIKSRDGKKYVRKDRLNWTVETICAFINRGIEQRDGFRIV